jgi:hypothetical protein
MLPFTVTRIVSHDRQMASLSDQMERMASRMDLLTEVAEAASARAIRAEENAAAAAEARVRAEKESDAARAEAQTSAERAKQEATRIYRSIGVETAWLDHPVTGPQESTPPRVSEIYVNIIPQATQGLGLFSNSLGLAPGEGRNRARLYVCYDRVESLYRKQIARVAQHKTYRGATTAQILGYAIAHEIGHLLGLDAHSDLGIMRQVWSPTDLLNLAYDDLAFTAQQAAVIRTEVEMRQHVADGVPEPRGQN